MKPWLKTLGNLAPKLATALGGPLAGMAANAAVSALGLKKGSESENLKAVEDAVLSGDPNVFLKLKEAEHRYEIEIKNLELDHEKVHQRDRKSARVLASKNGAGTQTALSAVYTVGYFTLIIGLLSGHFSMPDGETTTMVAALIGVMTAAQKDILQFWFGSSVRDRDK